MIGSLELPNNLYAIRYDNLKTAVKPRFQIDGTCTLNPDLQDLFSGPTKAGTGKIYGFKSKGKHTLDGQIPSNHLSLPFDSRISLVVWELRIPIPYKFQNPHNMREQCFYIYLRIYISYIYRRLKQ